MAGHEDRKLELLTDVEQLEMKDKSTDCMIVCIVYTYLTVDSACTSLGTAFCEEYTLSHIMHQTQRMDARSLYARSRDVGVV